jgi:hypothetical protein
VAAVATSAPAIIATAVVKAANTVAGLVDSIIAGDYSQSFEVPLDLKPPALLLGQSPWGPGVKLHTFVAGQDNSFSISRTVLEKIAGELIGPMNPRPGLDIWCVGCEVRGRLKVSAALSVSIVNGITKGTLSIAGNMGTSIYIGLDAFARLQKILTYELLKVNLAGFSIPKIISVGPTLNAGVSVNVSVSSEGQLYIGTTLDWPAVKADVNILSGGSSTASGWTPSVGYDINPRGSLSSSVTVGLPVGINFGFDVLNGKWVREVKLTDTPGIQGSSEF